MINTTIIGLLITNTAIAYTAIRSDSDHQLPHHQKKYSFRLVLVIDGYETFNRLVNNS